MPLTIGQLGAAALMCWGVRTDRRRPYAPPTAGRGRAWPSRPDRFGALPGPRRPMASNMSIPAGSSCCFRSDSVSVWPARLSFLRRNGHWAAC